MSDTPFGFGLPPEEPENGDEGKKKDPAGGGQGSGGQSGNPFGANPFGFGGLPGMGGPGGADNPFAAMFGSLNPNDLGAAFQQLGQMLSYEGGPVNWDMAKQIARQVVAQGTADGTKDASVGPAEKSAVEEAVRLADLWLDQVTSLPSGANTAVAWSRAEWVEATLPAWQQLVDPVAERVGAAMGDVLPEEMQAMAGPLIGMMRSMGGAMFGQQIGQAVGALAGEVVGSTDVGLPLGPANRAALLPLNIAAFGRDLGVPSDEVRLYLALREAAHQRLFAHVPWLRAHLFGAVEGYARGITVDTSKLEEAVGQLDPTHPEQLQEALQQGMFQPEDTPQQKAALARLETALALVEGWVDAVVHEAAKSRLTSADALRETLRRRRASGGPAEQTFATLIGLELRPRRLRDAARLWASLTDARGVDGRDGLWEHPDMLPTATDLDDPDGFVHREHLDFSELDKMLGEAAKGDAPEDGDGKGVSLHDDAVLVLKEYGDQEELRQLYLDHLDAHPDGMYKPCGAGHLTSSALVIDPERGRVLLTLHRKLGMWLQMGGHCEPGDTTVEASALREATEESGIGGLRLLPGGPVRLDRHPIPAPCHWHLDVQYAALAPADAVAAISEESLDLRWFAYEEVAGVADTSVVRLLEGTLARLER